MEIHCIQHVAFETPAHLLVWAERNGHNLNIQLMENTTDFPDHKDFDFLIIMGGPMGVQDEDIYPWLNLEKAFIQESIQANKYILGICLGAQILAEVLGGKVSRNPEKEIGWFPLQKTDNAAHPVLDALPDNFMAFHWHGDTFSIPENMIPIGQSNACLNQGFFNDHILALQFHLESTQESVQALIENCRNELVQKNYIQKEDVILKKTTEHISTSNQILESLLDAFL